MLLRLLLEDRVVTQTLALRLAAVVTRRMRLVTLCQSAVVVRVKGCRADVEVG